MIVTLERVWSGTPWLTGALGACVILTTALLSCTGDSAEPDADGHVAELEARTDALEESIQTLESENAELRGEVAGLRESLDALESRLQKLQEAADNPDKDPASWESWAKDNGEKPSLAEGAAHEAVGRLAEEFGGQVHYLEHPEREIPAVLVTPLKFVDGDTPLIVALHGFGGNAADIAAYVPLHERVNSDGFALLLPTGVSGSDGTTFWNPTDRCCEGGKTGEDDVAYLTELVESARKVGDFGHVYFFGYSNGGVMSYHMACKGLPGLRAVASLAGTSYVEDSSCEGAPPVSVLHIHGTADGVILFEGHEIELGQEETGDRAFYVGAQEMVTRWSERAGCKWPENVQPYAGQDLDRYVPGAETQAFRLESGCAEGITIELWAGEGSSHAPGYDGAFLDALLDWLLSQE